MAEQATSNKRVRTCVGCQARSDKMELSRIVRTGEGVVEYDRTGRKPGRGAYVCSVECLKSALANRKLQRALKTGINEEEASRIIGDMTDAATGEGLR